MKHPTNFHAYSPLVELLDQRHKMLGLGEDKPYRVPVLTELRQRQIIEATDLHRQANSSDPFAAARACSHMKRGLELPSVVSASARTQLAAKRRATEDEAVIA